MVRWFDIIFLILKSLDKILCSVTIQMKLLWQTFCMVLFYFLETFKKKFGGMCVTKLVFITHLVIGDVQLYCSLSYFPNIVVTFLHSQSSKTKSRLSTTPCKPRKNTQSTDYVIIFIKVKDHQQMLIFFPFLLVSQSEGNWWFQSFWNTLLLTMLLWKIHCKLVKNLPCIATKDTKKCTITIHYNETKLIIIC